MIDATCRTLQHSSTKTYTHEVGLSCCFRQWRARSHCKHLHGYALQVSFEFYADELDENGWVMDFGNLKSVKEWLTYKFDHQTLVATDDPEFPIFQELQKLGLLQLQPVKGTGCESFATMIFEYVEKWLSETTADRVQLRKVEVREHGGNSAIVTAR